MIPSLIHSGNTHGPNRQPSVTVVVTACPKNIAMIQMVGARVLEAPGAMAIRREVRPMTTHQLRLDFDSVKEEWGAIPGYEGLYEASTEGRVRRVARGFLPERVLQPYLTRLGYYAIKLRKDQKDTGYFVHRLVLETFRGQKPPSMECRHLDGTRTNNKLANLTWGTRKENIGDMDRHGTRRNGPRYGEDHHAHKLTWGIVKKIRADGERTMILAERYGVSKTTISRIRSGRRWRNV